MKIYTKTGDAGETGLLGGHRVAKFHARIEAYGTVDELNAAIGVALAESLPGEIAKLLESVQHRLFDLGAQLASPDEKSAGPKIGASHIAQLEGAIDQKETNLAPLRNFILPGGSKPAAALHLARCVARRAERRVAELAASEPIPSEPLVYLNRLGDLLFVLARVANRAAGTEDTVWQKEA